LAVFLLAGTAQIEAAGSALAACSNSSPCVGQAYSLDTPAGFQGALAYATPYCHSTPNGTYEYFGVRLTNASPERFSWITNYTEAYAGVPC
jgi:hypothetical protein